MTFLAISEFSKYWNNLGKDQEKKEEEEARNGQEEIRKRSEKG